MVLGAAAVSLLAAALAVDLPSVSGGGFWSDGATYHSMAASLAWDGDVRYEARDVARVRREFPQGPQGLFLKRASGGLTLDLDGGFPWVRRVGKDEPRLYYAKAMVYPLAAAPLVRLFGTNGMLLLNAASIALAMVLAYAELRRRATPGAALAFALVLFFASVAPVYLLWLTPEAFNLGLAASGLAAWRRGRPLLAAVLLGIATYSKPTNLLLALPLGLDPLLGGAGAPALPRRILESARRGAVLAASGAAFLVANAAATGELNYQGGERKTFYGVLPLEADLRDRANPRTVTFGSSGTWATTEHVGPLVQGEDEALQTRRTGVLRDAAELRASFLRNLGYFWIGRFGGAVPYFLPVVVAGLLFVVAGPRDRAGWMALAALLLSFVAYVRIIPDNWYGGSGTLGNRYFLNLVPLAAFLVPRGREALAAGIGAAGAAFVVPLLAAPAAHSLQPGRHAMLPLFRALPAELTMLNDLAIFQETWRKKRPFGDTEGDPHKHWPADPRAYWLYFLDDGTWGKETREGAPGFWLRSGSQAEVVLRVLVPVRRVRFAVTGGPAGDEVRLRVGGREATLAVGPGETREAVLEVGEGFPYYDTRLHVLRLRSRPGGGTGGGARPLGAFVSVAVEPVKDLRPRPAGLGPPIS